MHNLCGLSGAGMNCNRGMNSHSQGSTVVSFGRLQAAVCHTRQRTGQLKKQNAYGTLS